MLHIAVHYSSGGGYFWTIYPCPCHCCSRMGAVNLGSQLWYMVNHTKLMPVWASLSAGHLAVLWIFIIFIEYLFQRFLRNFLSKINYETWNKRTFTRQIFSWTVTFYSGHSSLAKQSILYSQLWGRKTHSGKWIPWDTCWASGNLWCVTCAQSVASISPTGFACWVHGGKTSVDFLAVDNSFRQHNSPIFLNFK